MSAAGTYRCRRIIRGRADGEALVSKEPLCFYLCEPETGEIIDKNHPLRGRSVAGKILVLQSGKGSSVVQLDGLFQLAMKGNLPKAIVVIDTEPVLVSSAFVVDLPMVDRFQGDPYAAIHDGDHVVVDADAETVEVVPKE